MRCSLLTMLVRSMLIASALVAVSAAPASAAPWLSPFPKPCYVAAQEEQREYVPVVGLGFTPFEIVDLFVDEIQQPETPPALFNGGLDGTVRAPFVEEGQRAFTLRAAERNNPDNTATVTGKVTRLSVEQIPSRAATRERVRFRGRGFTEPTKSIYAHYVFAGRSRKTVRIGRPDGDCGLFSVKRRQFPFKKSPRIGVWTIQFDQERRYNPKATVRVPLPVRVRRTIKPERARGH